MRATNYSNKPPDAWTVQLAALANATHYLVARPGPSVFVVKDDADVTARVTLGNPHKCSCGQSGCIHLAYCMTKVLKVPKEHPLSFQSSLTDSELDLVLSGSLQGSTRSQRPPRVPQQISPIQQPPSSSSPTKSKLETGFVPRQPLETEGENTCTICQDDMSSESPLTWCRHGCGNNFHALCMMKFAQHKISNHQDPSCPLCREMWDMAILKLDCRVKTAAKHPCESVQCASCTCKLRRLFHRCVECSQKACNSTSAKQVDFCPDCLPRISENHRGHHFLTSDASIENIADVTWHPAKNPLDAASSRIPLHLDTLQHRELTVNDYDLLLQLDQKVEESISSVLVGAMGEVTQDEVRHNPVRFGKCWCTNEPGPMMLVLPCSHIAHRQCLREEVSSLAAQDISSLAEYRCPQPSCGKLVFGCLRRRKKRPKPAVPLEPVSETASDKKSGVLRSIGHLGDASQPLGTLAGSALLGLPQIAGIGMQERMQLATSSSARPLGRPEPSSQQAQRSRRHSLNDSELDRSMGISGAQLEVGTLRSSSASSGPAQYESSLPLIQILRPTPSAPKRPPRGIGSLRTVPQSKAAQRGGSLTMAVQAVHLGGELGSLEVAPFTAAPVEPLRPPNLFRQPSAQSIPSGEMLSASKVRVGGMLVDAMTISMSMSREAPIPTGDFGVGSSQHFQVPEQRARARDVMGGRRPTQQKAPPRRAAPTLACPSEEGDALNQLISVVHYR